MTYAFGGRRGYLSCGRVPGKVPGSGPGEGGLSAYANRLALSIIHMRPVFRAVTFLCSQRRRIHSGLYPTRSAASEIVMQLSKLIPRMITNQLGDCTRISLTVLIS